MRGHYAPSMPSSRSRIYPWARSIVRSCGPLELPDDHQRISITVNMGGPGLPDGNATNPEELIGGADVAMYTAKESGRDRCVIA